MPRVSDFCLPRFFILFIAVSVLAAVGLPLSAGAQSPDRPATDRAALESLAGRLHQQALRERPELLRILNDANPAQQRLAADPDIQLIHIDRRDRPLYYRVENLIAAQSVGTDRVWPGGTGGTALAGSGLPAGALAVWDAGGVLVAHQEFGGRATQMDSPSATHYHSTHVAGTMIGAGVDPAAHGMAHQALLAAYDWNDAEYEMALAAADGMLISNHSYGFATGWTWSSSAQAWYWYGDVEVSPVEDHYFGLYSAYAAEYDQIAYDAPYYTIVKSAGNDRDDAGPGPGGGHYYYDPYEGWTWSTDTRNADGFDGGYDCLPTHGAAKNILTIGAVDDIAGGYADPGDVVMSGFSSWGPTDDGRIKPDLVANGIGLYSTTDSGTDQYRSLSGTSMSSPNLSGSLALIAEHFNAVMGEVPLASTVKAILVQTCDEAGPSAGPDYQHGWGLLNTARAVELISAHPLDPRRIVEGVLADGESDRYYFHSDGLAPLRFTIAWTDPPGTPPSDALDPADPMLVNDLDLRVESLAGPGIHEPYVLDPAVPEAPAATGDNVLDNVEHIHVAAPAEGDYIVRITHKGSLAQPQAYALAASHPLTDHKVCWGGDDFQTLQAAIDAAQSGEVIELCCDQPFSGPGNRDLDFQGKNLVVRSACGNPLRCVIDCGGSAAEPHRAFLFQSGETAASRLEGLTLRNGHAGTAPGDEGGAVLCANASSPELIECILAGNEAATGGGLAVLSSAEPRVVNCIFEANAASAAGGGALVEGDGAAFIGCTFAGNSAAAGGGLHCTGPSALALLGCTFYENDAALGSGVVCDVNCSPQVENTVIAFGSGGAGIACVDPGSLPVLSCCDLFGNEGGDWVGAIAGQLGSAGNLSLDPLFCGEFNPLRPYLLGGASPCAAENNPGCGQIGAWPVGCDAPQSRDADWEASARTMLGTAPNPFVRATQVQFDIPERLGGAPLTLRLLDAAGRLVRVLRAGPAEPGYHSVAWDGRDLLGRPVPGGLYFGELRVGGERTTQRVIVVR